MFVTFVTLANSRNYFYKRSMQDQTLQDILSKPVPKEIIIKYISERPELFQEAVALATTNQSPQNWRSCWIIFHIMEENDERVKPYISNFIQAIHGKPDGHQRELIKVLSKMELDDGQEGELFDVCMTIWESPKLIPSIRMMAFRFMMQVLKKYPELIQELNYLTQPQYLESLSPGIKNSVIKQFADVKKQLKL